MKTAKKVVAGFKRLRLPNPLEPLTPEVEHRRLSARHAKRPLSRCPNRRDSSIHSQQRVHIAAGEHTQFFR